MEDYQINILKEVLKEFVELGIEDIKGNDIMWDLTDKAIKFTYKYSLYFDIDLPFIDDDLTSEITEIGYQNEVLKYGGIYQPSVILDSIGEYKDKETHRKLVDKRTKRYQMLKEAFDMINTFYYLGIFYASDDMEYANTTKEAIESLLAFKW